LKDNELCATEKDLENQVSSIAARPSTIGCLLEVSPKLAPTPDPSPVVAETAAVALARPFNAILGTLLAIAWRFVARHTKPA
jgi:hypothetical protein